jgi:Domain of unknown function (DUF6647)
MKALLTAIVLWLAANFDLPATNDHPRVEFVPSATITALRYKHIAGAQPNSPAEKTGQRDVVAVYDDATSTIYLPEGWTGSTPAELSVLVHEMVHHIQNRAKLKFECPRGREKLAYEAQERWLQLFGRDLERDFEIDGFTRLLNTSCYF